MDKAKITYVGSIHGDEYYTLERDAEQIVGHLTRQPLKVWCPFNDKHSVWERVLTKAGHIVITTDTDFLKRPLHRALNA